MENFTESIFSALFNRHKDSYSELLDTQSDVPYECYFLAPEVKRLLKGGLSFTSPNKILTRSWNFCIVTWFYLRNLIMGSPFVAPLFDLFWGTPEISLCPESQKMPISLKITPRSRTFARRYNIWSEILYRHSFMTNQMFCLFCGHPGGQIGVTEGQILSSLVKTTSRSWICAQRTNFS